MPPTQQLTSRATFSRILQRICRTITEQSVIEMKWKDFFLSKEMEGAARILKIWAVGSWAQGLAFCGDLDLVVDPKKAWIGKPTF